jgi:hypothetical protein
LQITSVHGLFGLRSRLETDELSYFYERELSRITDPIDKYKSFHDAVLRKWSTVLSESSEEGPYRELVRETISYKNSLEEKVRVRRMELETGLSVEVRSRVRMRREELERTLKAARRMVMDFFGDEEKSQWVRKSFWEGRGLQEGDWGGLAVCLFCEVFSQEVLTPLEEEIAVDQSSAVNVYPLEVGWIVI